MQLRTVEILGLLLLAAYVFAGASLVPFHMDESIFISVGRNPSGHQDPKDEPGPHAASRDRMLVLVNGTVPNYTMMLSWKAFGFTVADLNHPWVWGRGQAWNRDSGRMPDKSLLAAARRPPALFTAASVLLIFALTRRWAGPGAAWVACVLFATHSAVLVHGRRAMTEGPLLFFGLAAVLAAVSWAGRGVTGERSTGWRNAVYALALAVASGFAVASKHSAVAAVAGTYAALSLVALRGTAGSPKRRLGWIVASGVVSVFVFFALNPAWWDAPLSRTREVLELRRSIVAGQTTTFAASAYADVGDRITGMLAHLSSDGPQYSESPGWPEALGAEVRTYRDSLWSGVPYGGGPFPTLLGFALFALTVLGAVRLVRDLRSEDAGAWLLLAWAVATAGFILLAIPLDWQRYYVPLYPIQMILAGAGASGLVAIARRGRWGGLDGSAP